jgi:hypothetical protein
MAAAPMRDNPGVDGPSRPALQAHVALRRAEILALSEQLQAARADERADAIRKAIAGGLSRSEVARRLGVTPQAITKVLHRG